MRGQPGFFDIDDRLKRLSDLGDQLETFRSTVDFELFRNALNPFFDSKSWIGSALRWTPAAAAFSAYNCRQCSRAHLCSSIGQQQRSQ